MKITKKELEFEKIKARKLELCILGEHIGQQIYQQTINRESVIKYIEDAISELDKRIK